MLICVEYARRRVMQNKNEVPAPQDIILRPRINALVEEGLRYPVLMFLAGPGYGKTQAMLQYLADASQKVLWIRLTHLDNLPTHFWEHFLRSMNQNFPAMFERMKELAFPDAIFTFDVFLQILTEELTEEKTKVLWVFDDFGEMDDPSINAFVRMLVDSEIDNFCLVLLSSVFSKTESVAFMTSRQFLILGKDLKFTKEEINDVFQLQELHLSEAETQYIMDYTEGWPLAVHLLALQHAPVQKLGLLNGVADDAIPQVFEKRFFKNYTNSQQKLLIKLSLLNSFTKNLAYMLCNESAADMDVLVGHVFLIREPVSGHLSFHNLYRIFLQEKKYELTQEEQNEVWQKSAEYHVQIGDAAEAIACYRKSGDYISMLRVIVEFAVAQASITKDAATYLLEHLDLLTEEQRIQNPATDMTRALIYLNLYKLKEADAVLQELEQRLQNDIEENEVLLGDFYVLKGLLHMMRIEDDFSVYYQKAITYLPNGSTYLAQNRLKVHNSHSFFMPNNLPGAKEKMEATMHEGIPLMAQLMDGSVSGMQYLFSAERAYLSFDLDEAIKHAHRGIYTAEVNTQHDLVCNGHLLLARIAFMQGDYKEMEQQIRTIEAHVAEYEIPVLNEIRDTALGWYYSVLKDMNNIPKSVTNLNHANLTTLTYGRPQMVYANYLMQIKEYARMVGMLEQSKLTFSISGIWQDSIILNIMLAVGYYYLGNIDTAMQMLWEAYDMCYNNGLVTLFVETEENMCLLIETARKEKKYNFDMTWLDEVETLTRAHIKRAANVRTQYKKKNMINKQAKSPLTTRELDVLQDMARGLTREEIAAKQFVSVNTVKTFIRNIYTKLNAANRAEAIAIAISKGYLNISNE